MNETTGSDDIDREALMASIRQRVEIKRASGLYTVDALAESTRVDMTPYRPDELADLGRLVEIAPDLALARSDRSGIGKIVGGVKTGLVRATSQPLLDTAEQASTFNALLLAYVTELSAEVMRLRTALEAQGLYPNDEAR